LRGGRGRLDWGHKASGGGWDSPCQLGGVLDGEGECGWEWAVGVLDAGEGALEWNACVHSGSDEGVYEAGDEDGCGGRLFLCGVPGGVGEDEIDGVEGGCDVEVQAAHEAVEPDAVVGFGHEELGEGAWVDGAVDEAHGSVAFAAGSIAEEGCHDACYFVS
jgi:hypothetical protein